MAFGESAVRLLLSSPFTWLALATVVGLEAIFFAWFQPSAMMLSAALALGGAMILAWPFLYMRSASFLDRLYELPERLLASQEAQVSDLRSDFEELDFSQGVSQVGLLREKFENLVEVLKRRLSTSEITYGRYVGMAEQVYLSSMDNLKEVAVSLRSVSTIDPEHVHGRLTELQRQADSEERVRETEALERRADLFKEQMGRVAKLMAQNESAMTVIDRTATALAQTKTDQPLSSIDAESAMAELERLARRASSYAASRGRD